jgi:PIN domain nuclease of toxin-antitoxin system
LWWLADDPRLGAVCRRALLEDRIEVLLSAAVVWEVALKRSIGKLEAPAGFAATLLGSRARELPVTAAHAEAAASLPWHPREPFDRIIAAQAMAEGASLASGDEVFDRYGVRRLWA